MKSKGKTKIQERLTNEEKFKFVLYIELHSKLKRCKI